MKSERLKKLESELQDLDQWLKLGLVPKKDLEKHRGEIASLREKIEEERERLRFLKESGNVEEYTLPKKATHGRQAFADATTLPDLEAPEEGLSDFSLESEGDSYEFESSSAEETESGAEKNSRAGEEEEDEEDEDEDPFSDRNRWKRGVLENPDVDEW